MQDRRQCYETGRSIGRFMRTYPTAVRLAVWVPLMVGSAHVAGLVVTAALLGHRFWQWSPFDLVTYLVVVTALGVVKGISVALDE